MNEIRVLRQIALLLLSSLFVTVTPLLAEENVIELSGGCTLHDAIIAANTDTESGACPAGRGADTIRLTADIRLAGELPPIVSTISIEGEGRAIDALQYTLGTREDGTTYVKSGRYVFRILQIKAKGVLTIDKATLKGGYAERGGALFNQGVVYVHGSQLTQNSARESGGAIYNSGIMRIHDSQLIDNDARYMGGAVHNDGGDLIVVSSAFLDNSARKGTDGGGGLYSSGQATITDSRFAENSAGYGAAITNEGDMRIIRSIVEGNEGRYAGTLQNYGWLTIEQSKISNNSGYGGAGIESEGATSRLVVRNSTVSGNKISNSYGGGITAFGTVVLTHVTIVNNEAQRVGGIYLSERVSGLVVIRNSIVTGNSPFDCTVGLHENVNSIIGDGSCDAAMSGDPRLEYVGGRFVPATSSPAIAAGDPLFCMPVDQYGNTRPIDEPCDIGAVESTETESPSSLAVEPYPKPTPTVCTLALTSAYTNTCRRNGSARGSDQACIHIADTR
jgi:predicted outer membrane repeat protein